MGCCTSRKEGHSNDENHATNERPTGKWIVPPSARAHRLASMSRHVQARAGRNAVTTEYVNIMEAARRCGVSDKTIRRAIHKGTLPARFPQLNRCEIALSDLERFMPGQPPGHVQAAAIESRIAALERRVQALEQQIHHLLSGRAASKPDRPARRVERPTGPLPKRFVPLLTFAERHNVAELKVQTHVEMGLLPVKRGEWTDAEGTVVMLAFDAKGRKAFYQLYRDLPHFTRCSQCPHGYLDTV
jgi:excisionase family DNA binding protein